ncbi:hypothetical protein KL938_004243 [Ogataea parapolymorpha]|nr:hypothetical protein KL938_004243 [Ogataea parapolymorpha]
MSAVTPVQVKYCGVCSFPVEFCEFGKKFKKCKAWLEEDDPELYKRLYSESAHNSSLSSEKEAKISESLAKMQLKEERKLERELQSLKSSKVLIKRIQRTKHKHVIAIAGLEVFDVDMKKMAKTFASKFATGASVTKNAEKKDEVVIQGDVGDEVETYILGLLKEKGLEDVKVEQNYWQSKGKAGTIWDAVFSETAHPSHPSKILSGQSNNPGSGSREKSPGLGKHVTKSTNSLLWHSKPFLID